METVNKDNKNAKIPKWLAHFYSAIPVNNSFIFEMNKQLSVQFKTLTNYDLENNFILMNHFPVPFKIVNEGEVYSINGDLVGSHMGYLIQICWKLIGEKKAWQPNDNIISNKIVFWWEYLPVSEIFEEEKKKFTPVFDTNTFNFPVETEIGVWPHLSLLVTCKNITNADTLKEYQHLFVKAQEEWNSKGLEHGIIHSVGKVLQVEDNSFQVQMDFGSAARAGLEFILNTIKTLLQKGIILKYKLLYSVICNYSAI